MDMAPKSYGTIINSELNTKHEGLDVNKFIVTKGKIVYQIISTLDQSKNFCSVPGASEIKWVDIRESSEVFRREQPFILKMEKLV